MSKPFTQAQWIWNTTDTAARFGVRRFRGRFTAETATRITCLVSADNRYVLYLDGVQLGRGPARSGLRSYNYETYSVDITPGEHVFAAIVIAADEYSRPIPEMRDRGGFLLEAKNANGKALSATGGAGWLVQEDTSLTPTHIQPEGDACEVGMMEVVHGSQIPWGWTAMEFDDTAWTAPVAIHPVIIRHQPGYMDKSRWRLVARDIPPMRYERREFENSEPQLPITVAAGETQEIILDAGAYAIGYPELRVSGGAGSFITLTYAEALTINGVKGRRDARDGGDVVGLTDTYHPGGGSETYEPLHWRAFRFVKLTVAGGETPVTVTGLSYHRTGYPWRRLAKFAVNDGPAELGAVQDVDFRTLQSCTWETFMDCPYYEQLQYVGDTRLQALLGYAATGDARLARRAVRQFDASRLPTGLTQSRFPSSFEQIIPPFSLLWILMVEDLWRYAPGASTTVASCLNGARGVLEWFGKHLTPDGVVGGHLPHWSFVDWVDGWDGGVPPPAAAGLPSATINLQYLAAMQSYIRLRDALGDTREAEFWQAHLDMLTDAITSTFWDEDAGLLREGPDDNWGYTQHAQAWGLLTGVVPQSAIEDVVESLHTDETLAKTSFYHTFYVVEALAKVGRLEKLWSHWLQPWRTALDLGFTTWPEKGEPTRSDCHAWSAWPTYAFLTHVLGVKPKEAGYAKYEIKPNYVDGWDQVTGTLPTTAGLLRVTVDWDGDTPKVQTELVTK
jgi:alpha-L-rhamnosidase